MMVVRSHAVLEGMLVSERTRLCAKLGRKEAWVDADLGCGNHIAEDATPAFEQARDLAVRACLEDMLVDVEAALGKLETGRYGICERCGCEIDWARLEAKPQARLCIRCQQRSELGH